jgi:hypothetical protein
MKPPRAYRAVVTGKLQAAADKIKGERMSYPSEEQVQATLARARELQAETDAATAALIDVALRLAANRGDVGVPDLMQELDAAALEYQRATE